MAEGHNPPVRRWNWPEDPGPDFPFYNGTPAPVSGRQWGFVLVMVVVAFLLLASPLSWPGGALGPFIPALLLPGLPLLALAWVAPGQWSCLFRPLGGRELRLMVGFALLNIVVSLGMGALVQSFTAVTPNGSTAQLGSLDTAGLLAFFAKSIPQLLGEEVITMLPFLALLSWLTGSMGMGRKLAVLVAWLVSALWFGLIHLPTYHWNWVQCLVVIGSARLVLTLPWILTKNLWVSTGAHILNDWLLFAMALVGAKLAETI